MALRSQADLGGEKGGKQKNQGNSVTENHLKTTCALSKTYTVQGKSWGKADINGGRHRKEK